MFPGKNCLGNILVLSAILNLETKEWIMFAAEKKEIDRLRPHKTRVDISFNYGTKMMNGNVSEVQTVQTDGTIKSNGSIILRGELFRLFSNSRQILFFALSDPFLLFIFSKLEKFLSLKTSEMERKEHLLSVRFSLLTNVFRNGQ